VEVGALEVEGLRVWVGDFFFFPERLFLERDGRKDWRLDLE
jgi:hypothetical protein